MIECKRKRCAQLVVWSKGEATPWSFIVINKTHNSCSDHRLTLLISSVAHSNDCHRDASTSHSRFRALLQRVELCCELIDMLKRILEIGFVATFLRSSTITTSLHDF